MTPGTSRNLPMNFLAYHKTFLRYLSTAAKAKTFVPAEIGSGAFDTFARCSNRETFALTFQYLHHDHFCEISHRIRSV
jgi:hypothetical protein